jgi:hypothetical protein
MASEKYSKSRAQEVRMQLQHKMNDYESLGKTIEALKWELREHCPHPDEYVTKLTDFRQSLTNKRTALWYCKLCQQTKGVEGP